MERTEYQVLAPDSVAWFIQAALVADRAGNVHTRDLALAEAQRIAAERRLVEQPAPAGHRHDGGFWITCPFCVDDDLGICSACNGTRRIWEMPAEAGA
jgi:hypothetical protein